MARIRSIHPGQWRDQDFVECSFAGRLLAIALRNEADDQGVFEWKPRQIKMNCFPGDNVDVDALLGELVANSIICRFEVEGRALGAIRNFRLYQRPKKANAIYPVTDAIREYVALSGSKFGTGTELEDDEDGTGGELVGKTPQQMEDGGDKMEEVGGVKKASGAAPQLPSPPLVPFIEIPTNRFETTSEQYPVYEPMIEEYQRLYPGVDVRAELRKMRGWSLSNSSKCKTKRGMKAFMNGWLSRQQDKPAPRETFIGGHNGSGSTNHTRGGASTAHQRAIEGLALLVDEAERPAEEPGGRQILEGPTRLAG